jgi:hypothetical protein
MCISLNCLASSMEKYEYYCMACYRMNYDTTYNPSIYNRQIKEFTVRHYISMQFRNLSWIFDKTIEGGISNRRPDIHLQLYDRLVIIEIDEHQHNNYTDEEQRIIDLKYDTNKPIMIIRLNVDKYTKADGTKVKSPWGIDKDGLCYIRNIYDWNFRMNHLRLMITYTFICDIIEKCYIIHMYYNNTTSGIL